MTKIIWLVIACIVFLWAVSELYKEMERIYEKYTTTPTKEGNK